MTALTALNDEVESAPMTAQDYVVEWCAQLGIASTGEPAQAAVAGVDELIRRNGPVSREEAYSVAQAAMLNWLEDTISGQPSTLHEQVNW